MKITRTASGTGKAPSAHARTLRFPLVTGILLGIGIAGFIDEAVFHQLLQWHNFYWGTDEHGRILSDGLFHVGSMLLLLWGAARLWRDRATYHPLRSKVILAGILIGAGGFNTYDGVVQHLIFHFHLVNEYACPQPMNGSNSIATCPRDLPYEIVWIGIGAAVAALGILVWRRAVREARLWRGDQAATRIASPGMMPEAGPVASPDCSPKGAAREASDEEGQHGDAP